MPASASINALGCASDGSLVQFKQSMLCQTLMKQQVFRWLMIAVCARTHVLHWQVEASNVRPMPEVAEVYQGVAAPKRKRVEEQPVVTEVPKVRGLATVSQLGSAMEITNIANGHFVPAVKARRWG